ncbi:DUF3221 domain-containing protein [Bacillus cereus]|nr:DUF3221 domain-containing protein [Bacillus cereus]
MNRHMKISMYIFLSAFLLVISACTTKQVAVKAITKEGYIILRNETVFLADDKTFETKIELQNYIEQQMNQDYPSDIVLIFKDKDAYDQLKTGDKIKVWSSQTFESYPVKMIVEKFEIAEK